MKLHFTSKEEIPVKFFQVFRSSEMLTYQLLFSVTRKARDSSEKDFRSHPLAEIENKAISLSDKMQQRHG